MELDLRSLFGLHMHCTAVLPANPPSTAFGLIYEGAIGQPRQTTSLCDPLCTSLFSSACSEREVAGVNSP
jgi:hypothetical protein